MKLPRDISGTELAGLFRRYGYAITRQTGSHIRLTTQSGGEHHLTIPAHSRFARNRLRNPDEIASSLRSSQ